MVMSLRKETIQDLSQPKQVLSSSALQLASGADEKAESGAATQ